MSIIRYLDSSGNNLNSRFDPYVSGGIGALTGYLDSSGNDLNTRFAPYVSGTIGPRTGYLDSSGNDLNTRFAPLTIIPNFPTQQSTIIGFAYPVCANSDGPNCVISALNPGYPTGSPYHYLYWSDNYGSTINKATIDGSVIKFYGCVAISGANAIAMGYTSSNATRTFYLSSDYGKTYIVTSTSGQNATGSSIAIDGAKAICSGNGTFYSTNYGSTWTASTGGPTGGMSCVIYGNDAYCGTYASNLFYSRNGGQSFTASSIVGSCVTKCGTTLYIGAYNNIYKSIDNGVTGTVLWNSTSIRRCLCIASCPGTSGDFVWFGNEDTSDNYYSNNGGTNWTQIIGVGKPYTCVVTSTRIISGGNSGFFWGKNAYITS